MDQELEITINRRRFDQRRGVRNRMTADDLAGLVDIPPDNAVVEKEIAPNRYETVRPDQTVGIAPGSHFLVTRKFVMGG